MRFAIAPLYLIERKHQLARGGGALLGMPEALDVSCPRCQQVFIGECLPDDVTHEVDSSRLLALTRLAEECPSHAHIFVIGGSSGLV